MSINLLSLLPNPSIFGKKKLYEIISKKYGNDVKEFTKSWKWYLDDCFIFWKCPMEDINELHNLLQNLHPKIKFTMEHSSKELPFLDILIKDVNGQIVIDIYHKPTYTQHHLHFKSHHPKSCIKYIRYTLTRRIHTIITDKNLKNTHLKELYTTLNQSGYPINNGSELSEKILQGESRKPKNTTTRNP